MNTTDVTEVLKKAGPHSLRTTATANILFRQLLSAGAYPVVPPTLSAALTAQDRVRELAETPRGGPPWGRWSVPRPQTCWLVALWTRPSSTMRSGRLFWRRTSWAPCVCPSR